MKPCPSVQELERLLEEELDDSQQEALIHHVGSCASCQSALERLTEPADELQSVSHGGGRKHDADTRADIPDSQTAFLAHLKAFPPPLLARTAAAATAHEKAPVY